MKYKWHFIKGSENLMVEMVKRKVTHVVQYKKFAHLCYSRWYGELDNDNYFQIQVVNGSIIASMNEREMMISLEALPIAYVHEMSPTMESPTDNEVIKQLSVAKLTFLPQFTKDLSFEEIMELFKWEYASPNVEMYEHIT